MTWWLYIDPVRKDEEKYRNKIDPLETIALALSFCFLDLVLLVLVLVRVLTLVLVLVFVNNFFDIGSITSDGDRVGQEDIWTRTFSPNHP